MSAQANLRVIYSRSYSLSYRNGRGSQCTDSSNIVEKLLLPDEHLIDAGYVTAEHLVNTQAEYNIEVAVPVQCDPSWQAGHNSKFSAPPLPVH